jgi:hypothetical protein
VIKGFHKIGSQHGTHRSRIGLYIDAPNLGIEIESLQSPFLAKSLKNVDVLVSTVVSSTGKALGILVRQERPISFHGGAARQVLEKKTVLRR